MRLSSLPHIGPARPAAEHGPIRAASHAAGWLDRLRRLPLLALCFLLIAGPSGLFLALVVPLGQVPDEGVHAVRADAISRGQIIGRRDVIPYADGPRIGAGVDADPTVVWAQQLVEEPRQVDPTKVWLAKRLDWTKPAFIEIGTTASYFPAFYIPAAGTLLAIRAIGGSPYQAVRAARIVNLVVYLLLGAAALMLARRGRTLLFCALAVPMALHLAGSVNQDGLIIATSVLAAALVSRAWNSAAHLEQVSAQGSYRLAALAIMLVVAVKPPYFPLTALLLLPLPGWREIGAFRHEMLRRLLFALACILPGAVWTAYALGNVSAPMPLPAYHPGPLWPGDREALFLSTDVGAQAKVLLAHPRLLITLPLDSFRIHGEFWEQMIGSIAWLRLYLPSWMYWVWSAAIVAACLADLARPGRLFTRRAADSLLLALAILAAIWAVWLSQYLTWTSIGALRIEGPQGRYLLPLLPLAAMALSLTGCQLAPRKRSLLAALPVIAAAAALIGLPLLILATYPAAVR